MSDVWGLSADSPLIDLFGDLPIPALLAYVHQAWHSYVDLYKNSTPSFQKRTEPQLTKALAAYLRRKQDAGEQPFPGDFFGELSEYVLDKSTGLPKCIARTDIEWRLYGVPGLIIEFKILDGRPARREQYLLEGVMRFVVGRYGSTASAGAMFALLRKTASQDPSLILVELERNSSTLQCSHVEKTSKLLPQIAAFDTSHNRSSPHVSPFQLAHLFVPLPL